MSELRKQIKKQRNALKKRHSEQVKNKDSRGRFPSIILNDLLPKGVEQWLPKEGEHFMDIIPWLAGPNMPYNSSNVPVSAESEVEYVLDIFVHQNVGTLRRPFVCPYENFGSDCPICEFIKSNELPQELWKDLKTKRRVLYLVWVHDTLELERKGVQLLEISHYIMEEKIAEQAKQPRGGGVIAFSDPDIGQTIYFNRKGSGQKNTQYTGHKLFPREMPIPEEILDQSFSIDKVVHMRPTYQEIEKAFKSQRASIEKLLHVSADADAGSTFQSSMGDFPEDWDAEETERVPRRPRGNQQKEEPRKRRRPVAEETRKPTSESTSTRTRPRTRPKPSSALRKKAPSENTEDRTPTRRKRVRK